MHIKFMYVSYLVTGKRSNRISLRYDATNGMLKSHLHIKKMQYLTIFNTDT